MCSVEDPCTLSERAGHDLYKRYRQWTPFPQKTEKKLKTILSAPLDVWEVQKRTGPSVTRLRSSERTRSETQNGPDSAGTLE